MLVREAIDKAVDSDAPSALVARALREVEGLDECHSVADGPGR